MGKRCQLKMKNTFAVRFSLSETERTKIKFVLYQLLLLLLLLLLPLLLQIRKIRADHFQYNFTKLRYLQLSWVFSLQKLFYKIYSCHSDRKQSLTFLWNCFYLVAIIQIYPFALFLSFCISNYRKQVLLPLLHNVVCCLSCCKYTY